MKNLAWILLFAISIIGFGCGESGTPPTNTASGNSENTNTANSNTGAASAPEYKAAVLDLEKQANEAWMKKDGKFFEDFLADGFVGVGASGREGKAMLVKSISESPCEVKSVSFGDDEVVELGEGVVLLTSKTTADYKCGDSAGPSPEWAASVYVKDGDKWNAVYHQSAPTADTKGEMPPMPADAPKPTAMEDTNKDITAKLVETEKSLWDAYTKKDAKPFEEALAENFTAINSTGRENRTDSLKSYSAHSCEVKSHSLSDFHTSKISDDLYLLTYKADQDATCDGNPVPKTMWFSTIVKKDGDAWKGVFHMGTPAR